MTDPTAVYVLGTGAVGLPLAAFLAQAGRRVVAVRTSEGGGAVERREVTIHEPGRDRIDMTLELVPLAHLSQLNGLLVVTAKAVANPVLAAALQSRNVAGPVVILQNGLNVEQVFTRALDAEVYRAVLYVTSQADAKRSVTFRQIASCPVGIMRGTEAGLHDCVRALATPRFCFHAEPELGREVWKKTIINAVFNSVCPLLETDNGIFIRDPHVAEIGREIVRECLVLAGTRGVVLDEFEVLDQIQRLSRGSNGVFISTLQDLRAGRPTEIESLNLALARLAAESLPKIELVRTELLGRLVLAKARRAAQSAGNGAAPGAG